MGSRAGDARDYLADDIDAQGEEWDGEFATDYEALAEHLRGLPADDDVCENLEEWLSPFLNDSDKVEGTLYPDGDAMRFLVRHVPPDNPEHRYIYLQMFTDCAANDYCRWLAVVKRDGPTATWTVSAGRPDVEFDQLYDSDPLAD